MAKEVPETRATAEQRRSAHCCQLTAAVAQALSMAVVAVLAAVARHIHLQNMATGEAEITAEAAEAVSTAKAVMAEHMAEAAEAAVEATPEQAATAAHTVAVEAAVAMAWAVVPKRLRAALAAFRQEEAADT